MKIIKIPLVDKVLHIWVGKEEWPKFEKAIKRNNCTSGIGKPVPIGESGRAWGSDIWVNDKAHIQTVFHEVNHFFDDLYDYIGCTKESEFKAYLSGYVLEKVYKWLQEK